MRCTPLTLIACAAVLVAPSLSLAKPIDRWAFGPDSLADGGGSFVIGCEPPPPEDPDDQARPDPPPHPDPDPDWRIAFVGDVLFQGSIGHTDFPRGNHEQLIRSIMTKLWPLGDDITFVPGHGPTSTFGRERQTNPFVADRLTGYAGTKTEAPDVGEQRSSKRYT